MPSYLNSEASAYVNASTGTCTVPPANASFISSFSDNATGQVSLVPAVLAGCTSRCIQCSCVSDPHLAAKALLCSQPSSAACCSFAPHASLAMGHWTKDMLRGMLYSLEMSFVLSPTCPPHEADHGAFSCTESCAKVLLAHRLAA